MRFAILTGLVVVSTGFAGADPIASTEIGFAEVRTLGTLNGQALACRQFDASKEAKALMIGYAPKTRRYGILFETATNTAFLAATKGDAPCPTETDLEARLAETATALKSVFPEQAQPDPSEPQRPGVEPSPSIDANGS
jgi:hypothetical protein